MGRIDCYTGYLHGLYLLWQTVTGRIDGYTGYLHGPHDLRCGAFRQPGSGDAEVGAVGGAGTGPRDAAAAGATAAGELCPGAGTNDAWVRTCPVGSRRGGCGALRSRPTATTPMMRGGGCGAGDTGVAAGAARATSSGV